MKSCDTLEKIKTILTNTQDIQEKDYLIDSIEICYKSIKEKIKKKPAQLIEYDFQKKEVINYFEFLTEKLLRGKDPD